MRNYKFDTARTIAMFYIVGIFHLSGYVGYYLNDYYIGNTICFSCLGLFTFMSGYLLGNKYNFNSYKDVLFFYRKRFIRIYPLFIIASISLYLIGLNDFKQTIIGLIGLSPFVKQSPITLWYVSMIVVFYFILPLLKRKTLQGKLLLLCAGGVLFVLLRILGDVPIGSTFIYHYCIFTSGVILSTHLSVKKFDMITSSVKLMTWSIVLYILLLLLANYSFANITIVKLGIGLVGVFSFLSFSAVIQNIFSIQRITFFLSYGSMVAYMFHRLFYWGALKLYCPETPFLKVLYLFVIILPVIMLASYFIQKTYDLSVKEI